MKNYSIFVGCLLFASLAHGQISISPDDAFAKCPDQWITYAANNSYGAACNYYWEVTNGEIQGGSQSSGKWIFYGGNIISVKWKSSKSNGTIKAVASNCHDANGNGSKHLTIAIRTLQGVTPGTIFGLSSVPANNTANRVYEVPSVNYPSRGYANPNPYGVNDYEWDIPAGWTIISGGGNKKRVTVRPDAFTQGTIRVRGVVLGCNNSPYYSKWSQSFSVSRSVATPSAITGNGGLGYVVCGETAPITFTVPAVAGATSYTWTKPSGWSGSSTSNSITLTPNGTSAGVITVRAHSGPYTSSTRSRLLTIEQTDPNNPPQTSGPASLCVSDQGIFTVSNVPAGTTVTWSVWPGLSILSGQGTSSITVQANSLDGKGWVQATLPNSCGSPITLDEYYFSQGKPAWYPDNIQLTNGAYGESWFFCTSHYGNTYMINSENDLTTHQVRIKSLSGSVLWSTPTRTGKSGSVNYYPSPGYYLMSLRATNSCGTTPWIENEVEFVDCSIGGGGDGGEGGEGEAFSFYPNPSVSGVTIEEQHQESFNQKQEKSQVKFRSEQVTIEVIDSNQNLKHRESCTGKKLTFSVLGWEKGIYYIKITKGNRSQVERLIVE